MTASQQDYLFGIGLLNETRWSAASRMTTVPLMDDDAARVEFRENLAMTLKRVRRKATGYASQQSIANELGIDRETYGRWERGTQEPRVFDLARISTPRTADASRDGSCGRDGGGGMTPSSRCRSFNRASYTSSAYCSSMAAMTAGSVTGSDKGTPCAAGPSCPGPRTPHATSVGVVRASKGGTGC